MFHHSIDDDLGKSVFMKWYLLAFLAGNVNAGGFLAFERFVTHVTGFATLFGVGVAEGHYDRAVGIVIVPAFFLLGSMISSYLVDHRFHRGKRPHYDWVMALVFVCLVTAAALGHFDFFGTFGARLRLKEDFWLLSLLCLASGLQNAAITTASGATVRTTHLTGITTDLGIGLVRVLGAVRSPEQRRSVTYRREVRANWLRVGTIGSFILGSVAGAVLFIHLKYLGFLLPAVIAFYAFLQARLEHRLGFDQQVRGLQHLANHERAQEKG